MTQMLCIVCKHRELPEHRPQVCEPCQERMAKQLTMLERAVPLLAVVAQQEPTRAGHTRLDAVDLSLPGNPATTGEAGDQTGQTPVAARLASWAEDWSGRDIMTADAASVAQFLRRGLRWACASHPAVDEFAKELRQSYAAAKVGLNRDMRGHHYAAPCPHCGQKTLVRYPGADWIECGPCEALYDEQDYAVILVRALEASARRTWPPGKALNIREAAALAGVKQDVIRQWITRGKLQADIGPWGTRRYLRIVIDWTQAEIENRARAKADREREMVAS